MDDPRSRAFRAPRIDQENPTARIKTIQIRNILPSRKRKRGRILAGDTRKSLSAMRIFYHDRG
ncbi:hypothetical protein HRJ34_11360 [Rhizorhabdus wittichii]|uniref:Uncharacterized protein n=1 Tax=Rhizorhabdus wittichii TaxID=160791 RepID=A0A975HFZ2_9SPHN|nr:hypothetical protein HRJ34_11360 [Rhizorhabdus wittichii]